MRFVERHIPDTALPFDARSEWYVLSELTVGQSMEGVETTLQFAFEDELVSDAIIAKNDTESERLWRMRHSISEAQKPEGAGLKHDISVPIGRIAEFLAAGDELLASAMPAARLVAFGHVGDGNLHYDVAPPSGGDDGAFAREGLALTESIYELVASMGGSFSAEHGVGVFKKAYLEKYRGGAELELMRSMKQVLDPRNTLNPGKVI